MRTELDLSRVPTVRHAPQISLAGLSIEKIRDALVTIGLPENQAKMRSKQIRRWVHHGGVTDFGTMTNIAKAMRGELDEQFTLNRPEIVEHKVSTDGTQKWLVRFGPSAEGETVFIPDVARSGALCVSSQVGCTLNCTFCHTGTQRLVRNLTAQEIVAQTLIARDALGEWPADIENRSLSNIVFMGMGEPLYNM
ncbi:MAG: 23S rRNA (adenine(2503)-C(2))-methyltransferase RlmN, partial [Pseudomonadota bacterium]